MSENRPIEQLLKRYSKKRQESEAAPSEMHPVTRRLLQDEVARTYSSAATKGRRPVHLFWTRFGLAFALLLGLGAVTFFFTQQRPADAPLAQGISSQTGPPAELALNSAASLTPQNAPAASGAVPIGLVATAPAPEAKSLEKEADLGFSPLPGASPSESLRAIVTTQPSTNSYSAHRFLRVTADDSSGSTSRSDNPTPSTILRSFDFTSDGRNVRIIDTDGSLYVGIVVPDAASDAPQTVALDAESSPATASGGQPAEGSNYFAFRAEGMNQTLGQSVIFQGQFSSSSPATNAVLEPLLSGAVSRADEKELSAARSSLSTVSASGGDNNRVAGRQRPAISNRFLATSLVSRLPAVGLLNSRELEINGAVQVGTNRGIKVKAFAPGQARNVRP